jgi:NRPS condensation-like uncharacterized protein
MQEVASEYYYKREIIIERMHLRGPHDNIKMLIRLETPIAEKKLREAVKKISITHPLLSSRVMMDAEGNAFFTTDNVPEIPIKRYEKINEESYMEVIYQEDLDTIKTESGPLSRVIFLDHESNPEIIIYAHHVASDGLSLLYASKHLLEYLAYPEKKAEIIEPITYTDELMERYPPNMVNKFMINRVNKKWRKRKRIFTEEEYQELLRSSQRDHYIHISFSEEETNILRTKCRNENVTVNSALVTAMLSASRVAPELKRSDEVAFAVSIRKMLEKDPGEACGLYASGVTLRMKYSAEDSFWDNARKAHSISREKLEDPDALFSRRTNSIMLDPSIYDALIFATFTDYSDKMIEKFTDKIAKPNLGGIMTNLGGTRIPREYEGIRVSDVVFIPPASGGGILAIGASSIVGKLNLVIPYREPVFKEESAVRYGDKLEEILNAIIYKDNAYTNFDPKHSSGIG